MNKFTIIFLLIAFSFSCNSTKTISKKADLVAFTFRKTDCRGKCPVYYMEIFQSGKVTIEGTKNFNKIGKYSKQIDKTEVENLISQFDKADFANFANEYTASITDLPTTYIGYTKNDTTKTIRDYHGAPKELKALELLLENIAKSEDWIKNE